jgi:dimethylglycine dehydrogenase
VAPEYQRRVYDGLKQAGAEFNIRDFGMRALLSMRLEKNFPTWFAELRPIYGPFEGGMERFVKLNKADFIGRAPATQELADGPKLRRASFIISAGTCDVMGDEPIWAKTPKSFETIDPAHGHGAPRFDAQGIEIAGKDAQVDGDWRVVGWVTSGGYAHTVGASMAQGYIPTDLSEIDADGMFEIEILGERRAAKIAIEPPLDPTGTRMRG